MIRRVKKAVLLAILICGLILAITPQNFANFFSFPLQENITFSQETKKLPQQPENIEKVKEMGEKAAKTLPKEIEEAWREAVRIWKDMDKQSGSYIQRFLGGFRKITNAFGKELKRRESVIKEEYKKEREEMTEEIKTEIVPKINKNLWERFKELIK